MSITSEVTPQFDELVVASIGASSEMSRRTQFMSTMSWEAV